MKVLPTIGFGVISAITSVAAQEIVVESLQRNGEISFRGAQVGTTATVEWAASLTDVGRTNWHSLTNVVVNDDFMTVDIPIFFRVRAYPSGLLAHYSFSGNADDITGNGHHGHIVGATASLDRFGMPNNAYAFDGADDYITLGRILDRYDLFTFSLWFSRTNQTSRTQDLIQKRRSSKGDGAKLSIGSLTTLQGVINRNPAISSQFFVSGTVFDNNWHHAALTCSGSNLTLYVNGVLVENKSIPLSAAYSSEELWVGRGFSSDPGDGGGVRAFSGLIDDLRIYNRALQSNEIHRIYQNELVHP